MYRYEAHLHTAETSACGRIPAKEQVALYQSLGYTGFCVTDHFHNEYFQSLPHPDDWGACMDAYLKGYRLAKEEGEKRGFQVILGAEFRFPENERDYLVYGMEEEWFYTHPFTSSLSAKEFFSKFGQELLVIHAHPFRYNDEVYLDAIHGVEIVNGNPRHDSRNNMALSLVKEHPHLLVSVGSDCHRPGDEGTSAICTDRLIIDSTGFREMMLARDYSLWAPAGEDIISKSKEIGYV